MIDKDEYPQTAAIEERCIHILADLWNSPEPHTTIGTSAIGSSEACMLGGLAFKRRWQQTRKAEKKPTDTPNIVFSSPCRSCWEKFANYWDVEPRYVPITKEQPYLTPEGMLEVVDENTIGVVAILGVTYNGVYEPVKELAAAWTTCKSDTGLDIALHVDGASGAFIAPFLDPGLVWDFRLPRVHSISTSGHKFGLVYPGLGWVIWSKAEYLPEDLIFSVSYLGGNMPTLALNFSRPGSSGPAASTTTSCGWVARAIGGCNRRARTRAGALGRDHQDADPSRCSRTMAATCRSSRGRSKRDTRTLGSA